MYDQEKVKPYGNEGEKSRQVEQMFDNIAPAYDKLNHRLSWNIDRAWRRRAIRSLQPFQPKSILDVATGTGDFAILAAQKLQPERIIGIDLSDGMMQIGQQKVAENKLDSIISFKKDDCLALSFDDASFDAVISAFGIRNFQDLDKGLAEMCRVLKSGGQLRILELSAPVSFPMKQLFRIYSHTLLPLYGRLISRDNSAYSYLTASIEAFPQGEKMTAILQKAGFEQVQFRRLTAGICTLYTATKCNKTSEENG